MTTSGAAAHPFNEQSIVWSPDSKKIAAYRVTPGDTGGWCATSSRRRRISCSRRRSSASTPKPGDVLDLQQPSLFDVDDQRTRSPIDNALFPNPYDLSRIEWRKDSRAFTFEYNQRGHQVYRVIEVDATTGAARALVTETSKTFIDYRRANVEPRRLGTRSIRYDLDDGHEIIWMSERDGWAHLYLYDGATGAVEEPDHEGQLARARAWSAWTRRTRQIMVRRRRHGPEAGSVFRAVLPHQLRRHRPHAAHRRRRQSHRHVLAGQQVLRRHLVARRPRAGLAAAPRRATRKLVHASSSKADARDARQGRLARAGGVRRQGPRRHDGHLGRHHPPVELRSDEEVSGDREHLRRAAGLVRAEDVQRRDSACRRIAELGFIVVQIDGMGTANRSKAFHDVAWKNLGDAGFPDRILWHKAVAAKYPWYDITRVGIYGGSAGGQNSLGALLFHPEFYKVAVSFAGCHDNRMDKIWWNEQWMGWPIGPQYAASSNVGARRQPAGQAAARRRASSTRTSIRRRRMQVVNALIKANKTFDMLVMPGEDHPAGRRGPSAPYGDRKLWDFFVHNLLRRGDAELERHARRRRALVRRRRTAARSRGCSIRRRRGTKCWPVGRIVVRHPERSEGPLCRRGEAAASSAHRGPSLRSG